MIRAIGLASLLLLLSPALKADEAGSEPSLREAVDHMLSERESKESLEKAIAEARRRGASEQSVLEARFLYSVDRRDDATIASLAPEFLERRDDFRLEDSEIFGVREDWLAVVEYAQAIACLERDDREGFKRHITEAFWLSPKQGAAFAPHIDRLRLTDAMKKLKLDFSTSLETLSGEKTSLQTVVGERKALLLHFFSPWSRECEESLPDFDRLATSLDAAGIAVISIVGEADAGTRTDTLAILDAHQGTEAGVWAMDSTSHPLTTSLRIQSAPTMVLAALDGSILFNGHPSEDQLWNDVSRIAPDFKRPASAPSH